MKTVFAVLSMFFFVAACGGNSDSSKQRGSSDSNAGDGNKERIVCEGDECSAPKCDAIEGFSATENEEGFLNRREIPHDYEGPLKTCYPNGNIKLLVSWKNGWKFGDLYRYREDGSLETHEIWSIEEGKSIGKMTYSARYRPDGTCEISGHWNSSGFHGEHIQCNERGEVVSKAVWDNGKMVSCEGPGCR